MMRRHNAVNKHADQRAAKHASEYDPTDCHWAHGSFLQDFALKRKQFGARNQEPFTLSSSLHIMGEGQKVWRRCLATLTICLQGDTSSEGLPLALQLFSVRLRRAAADDGAISEIVRRDRQACGGALQKQTW